MKPAAPLVLVLGALAVLTGVEPWPAALAVGERVAAVLAFLLLVAVLAELCRDAGLFDLVADRAARLARGRVPVLYAAFVVVCVLATWLLSIDTTAVLLTPVALALTRRLRLDPWPFAFATLWLANTASLLLPVANLTNLLALHRLDLPTGEYVRLLAAPQAVVVVVTIVVLVVRHRHRLRGRYEPVEAPDVARAPALAAGCAALGLGTAVVLGAAPWMAAAGSLLVVVLALLRHDASLVSLARLARLAPWRMAGFALGLFVLVDAFTPHLPVDAVLPAGAGPADRVVVAVVAALGANAVDNLPAYLALEPYLHGAHQLAALLVGVNVGPLLTPWGSLATLLWLHVLRVHGYSVAPRELAREGVWVVIPAVVLGALAVG